MTKQFGDVSSPERPNAQLSRRSLVAAGAILASLGPVAASKALAQASPKGCAASQDNAAGCQCFLRGTRLATPDGETAVENLAVGDLVATHEGETRAIRWIGRRALSRVRGWSDDDLPVRIARGALGPDLPRRDLFVSRAHLLYLNGVLVPASDLVNGQTISVVTPDVDALEYFHVELGRHDVVLAEGAPCESLRVVMGRVPSFDNAAEYQALYGHLPPVDMAPYAAIASFNGGSGEFKSRLRSALAPVVDFRRPLDVLRDDIEARALLSKAA